jgi:hypothetical protein
VQEWAIAFLKNRIQRPTFTITPPVFVGHKRTRPLLLLRYVEGVKQLLLKATHRVTFAQANS